MRRPLLNGTKEPQEAPMDDNDTGLVEPDNLPDNILRLLSYSEIRELGYFLFSQLVKQRDHTRSEKRIQTSS